jgi:dihydropyrimidinase
MRTLIRHGTVVTASETSLADVLVEDGRIAEVGPSLTVDADRTIDATGKYVMPGGVDVHTHLDAPMGEFNSSDDFESGTIAAAFGGTTSIVDFATQSRGESLHQAWDAWAQRAEGRAVIDYGFHMTITDLASGVEQEMDDLVAGGITSFKVFMAYRGRLMLDDGTIFRVLRRTAANGGLVCVHAENGDVIDVLVREALAAGRTAPVHHARTRPALAEGEATHRAIALAEMAGAPVYIVHLSAAGALNEVVAARRRGLRVHGETCPQYLLLSDDEYERPGLDGAQFVMSPPLRAGATRERLWQALVDRDLEVVATDHCPFCLKDKARGRDDFSKIPNGIPGIETRMSLIYDGGVAAGRISPKRFVEITSAAPARIFGLYPRKGTIAPGSDADIIVFDPHKTMTLSAESLHMRVDYNPYEGRRVTGAATTVLSRGRVIVEEGRFTGRPGWGTFLKRRAVS